MDRTRFNPKALRIVAAFSAISVGATVIAMPASAGTTTSTPASTRPALAIVDAAMLNNFVGSANWLRCAEYRALSQYTRKPAASAIAYLVENQRPDGSWSYQGLPDRGWYFDHCTADALRALLEWYAETGDTSVVAPAKKTIELLLRTQGKEPQRMGPPYDSFSLGIGGLWHQASDPKEWSEPWWNYVGNTWTLGDGATAGHVDALAMAYTIFGDKRCKEAVLSCARSLERLQEIHNIGLPEHVGPRGEAMYGRPHEIPAMSTRAVCAAIDIYVDAHRVSRDPRWATAAKRSAVWLEPLKISSRPVSFQGQKSEIMWPSLVEFNTLKPVYGNAKGEAVYTVAEAVNPYGWWHSYPRASIDRAKAYFLKFAGQW